MKHTSEFKVQQIYEREWKLGGVDPLEDTEVDLGHFLGVVKKYRARVSLDHESPMLRESYPGKRVIKVELPGPWEKRVYYLVDREAIPILRSHPSWDESRCWRPAPGEEAVW